jgi:hypothetical protein
MNDSILNPQFASQPERSREADFDFRAWLRREAVVLLRRSIFVVLDVALFQSPEWKPTAFLLFTNCTHACAVSLSLVVCTR